MENENLAEKALQAVQRADEAVIHAQENQNAQDLQFANQCIKLAHQQVHEALKYKHDQETETKLKHKEEYLHHLLETEAALEQ